MTPEQVVHDFNNGAVALRRLFGPAFKIGRILDTQLALEVLHGDVHTDLDAVLKAFAGDHDSVCDGPHRCRGIRQRTPYTRYWYAIIHNFPYVCMLYFRLLLVVSRGSSAHKYSVFLKSSTYNITNICMILYHLPGTPMHLMSIP